MKPNPNRLDQCMIRDRHRFRRSLSGARTELQQQQLADRVSASIQQARQRRKAVPRVDHPPALPISLKAGEITKLVQQHRVLIVAGETGSGKSTQLPKICLAAGQGIYGQIAHTQPRRIAARAISSRLAEELELKVGAGVGYRVRFDENCSEADYIRVLTDGMLLAEAQSDHFLNRYDTIIVDEAHERSLNIDFLLGLLKQLLSRRQDLKVIITSATIDTDKFSRHFDNAPVINVSGRSYPVEIRYQPPEDEKNRSDRQTNQAIHQAIESLFRKQSGHTLVFLPGEREIREAQKFLQRHLKPGIEVLPLYARLGSVAQARLFKPSGNTRVILSTNVAETSLTLPGIRYVIDTGLARISRYNPGRRVNTLPIEPISQASANQRAGRCGRVSAGVCIRLYSEEDFESRAQFTAPEILRTALTGVVLSLKNRHLGEAESFPFIDPPERRQWNAARQELRILGALERDDALTDIGRALAKLPVDPRIGRMLYAAATEENCLTEVSILAASLELPDPRLVPHESMQAARQHHLEQARGSCDFFSMLKLYEEYRHQRGTLSRKQLDEWCRKNFLAPARMREWRDLTRRLRQELGVLKGRINHEAATEDAVHRALLSGLLDQVAMKSDDGRYTGTYGKQLTIFPGSALAKSKPKWIMAAEMVETSQLFARGVAPIRSSWIETLAGSLVRHEYSEPHWSARAGQVMAYQRGYFLNLPLFSGRRRPYSDIDPAESRALFIRDGLVTGDLGHRYDFIDHNLELLQSVARLEHKTRRHDLLVSDQALVNFYSRKLPQRVLSEPTLRKWLKQEAPESHSALYLTRADLLKRELTDAEAELPDHLQVGDQRLELDYQFAPGETRDGMTARVPLPLLNQLSQHDFERLVPGYLDEKIAHLVRTLPKSLRRQLAPLPESISHASKAIRGDDRPLLEALADILGRRARVQIQPRDFDLATLPAHLTMKLSLVDEQGDELATDTQLETLRQSFGNQATRSISSAAHPWQQSGLTAWSFGELPDSVELDTHGLNTRAYPALVDAVSCVNLQLFDDPEIARKTHRLGVSRLLQIATPFGRKLNKRPLPYWQEISLRYSPLGSHQDLRAALLDALVPEIIFAEQDPIRDLAAFNRAAASLERNFSAAVEPCCSALRQALESYSALSSRLDRAGLPEESEADIRTQVDFLVYQDFLLEVSPAQLLNYPLYFRAIEARLEKLAYDPQGDLRKLAQLAPYRDRYLDHWEAHPDSTELDTYRWLLEAYRVSLFAPGLKTPIPVSDKRLDAAWADCQASWQAQY